MSSVQRRSLVRDLFVSAALRFRTLRRSLRVPDLLLDEDEGAGHGRPRGPDERSEEHTSELQSRSDLVCRLLLEKKKMLYMMSAPLLFFSILCRRSVIHFLRLKYIHS